MVSDTFGGRVDRPQWWTVIKTRAKSYPQIWGLAARQEAALCAQPEKAEERGIAARRRERRRGWKGETGRGQEARRLATTVLQECVASRLPRC